VEEVDERQGCRLYVGGTVEKGGQEGLNETKRSGWKEQMYIRCTQGSGFNQRLIGPSDRGGRAGRTLPS
jgi:hypothetical protein